MSDVLDRRIAAFRARGWCPLPIKHHPPEVVAALKLIRMRPQMKRCFANSQRFLLERRHGLELQYVEGWASRENVTNFLHGWLVWRGEILDLTLGEPSVAGVVRYEMGINVSVDEVIDATVANQAHVCVRRDELERLRQEADRAAHAAYGQRAYRRRVATPTSEGLDAEKSTP